MNSISVETIREAINVHLNDKVEDLIEALHQLAKRVSLSGNYGAQKIMDSVDRLFQSYRLGTLKDYEFKSYLVEIANPPAKPVQTPETTVSGISADTVRDWMRIHINDNADDLRKGFRRLQTDVWYDGDQETREIIRTIRWFLESNETGARSDLETRENIADVIQFMGDPVQPKHMEKTAVEKENPKMVTMVTIYLAGGIANLDNQQIHEWRDVCKDHYRGTPVKFLDPTRNNYRGVEMDLKLSNSITKRDKIDIMASDIILAFCPRPSWGTPMEIIYASENDKWVVTVCSDPNPSPWLIAHSDVLVKTFEEAWSEIGDIIRKMGYLGWIAGS